MKYDVTFEVTVCVETNETLDIHDEKEGDKVIDLAIEKAKQIKDELFIHDNMTNMEELSDHFYRL
jgi:hypothetical protein